eukprot:3551-Heterococcus_DN1.PRE.1
MIRSARLLADAVRHLPSTRCAVCALLNERNTKRNRPFRPLSAALRQLTTTPGKGFEVFALPKGWSDMVSQLCLRVEFTPSELEDLVSESKSPQDSMLPEQHAA